MRPNGPLEGIKKYCPVCGAEFYATAKWAYKTGNRHGNIYYCSWRCRRTKERKDTGMEITRKRVLSEALEREERIMRAYSKNGRGLEAQRDCWEEFKRQQEKCRILREMIQALDSEPVRKALANWQKEVMDGKKTALFAPGGMET